MREGEALALQWGDLDFYGGFIHVQRTFTTNRRLEYSPKSSKSRRVDMSPQLARTLKALLEARKEEAWARG